MARGSRQTMRQSPQTGDNWVFVAGPVVVDRHFGRVYVYSVRGFLRIQKAQYKLEQGRHAFRATRTCVVGAPDLVYSSLRKYSRQSRLGVLNRHRGSPWLRGLVCVLECGPLKNWTPTWRLRVNPLILCLVTASLHHQPPHPLPLASIRLRFTFAQGDRSVRASTAILRLNSRRRYGSRPCGPWRGHDGRAGRDAVGS